MLSSMLSEGRMSFSYVKQKSEDSPKVSIDFRSIGGKSQFITDHSFIIPDQKSDSHQTGMCSTPQMTLCHFVLSYKCSQQITASGTTPYHLQRALPGGIVLIELTFQVSSLSAASSYHWEIQMIF